MLDISFTPKSIIFPGVTWVICIPLSATFLFVISAAPLAVTVAWAVVLFWLPCSSGSLNCLSALQKCEDADATTSLAVFPSINSDESSNPSQKVEHAP